MNRPPKNKTSVGQKIPHAQGCDSLSAAQSVSNCPVQFAGAMHAVSLLYELGL